VRKVISGKIIVSQAVGKQILDETEVFWLVSWLVASDGVSSMGRKCSSLMTGTATVVSTGHASEIQQQQRELPVVIHKT
jgi:hypothetical protein